MKHKLLDFTNIKEIKFTRVSSDDFFSMSIKSDIHSENKTLEDSIFETKLCKIGSNANLTLTVEDIYTNVFINNEFLKSSQCYEILLPIKLLVDISANEIATITQSSDK